MYAIKAVRGTQTQDVGIIAWHHLVQILANIGPDNWDTPITQTHADILFGNGLAGFLTRLPEKPFKLSWHWTGGTSLVIDLSYADSADAKLEFTEVRTFSGTTNPPNPPKANTATPL